MIYYLSGTGNSRVVAESLGRLLRQGTDKAGGWALASGESLGFVFPVYSWGIAPYLLEWIGRVVQPERKPAYVWAVLTYGDEAGFAHRMLRDALEKRGLKLDAVFGIQMPNTYVLLPGFDVDADELAMEKLRLAEQRVREIADKISAREKDVEELRVGPMPFLKSRLVFPLFKKWGIFPRRWHVDMEKCIGCGMCAAVCPVGNVRMVGQKPVYSGDGSDCGLSLGGGHPEWDERCISCLGCYHACPGNAVQYGRLTARKGQWRHWFHSKVKPLDAE